MRACRARGQVKNKSGGWSFDEPREHSSNMDPFWKTFFEEFKDRGRDATPFLITLAAMVCLLIVVGIVDEAGLANHIVGAVFLAVVFAFVWAVVKIVRARTRQRERWERRELSCDEWRVARSKLKKDGNRKGA